MKSFYVYAHIRKDTGSIFYIGKGSGKRAWVKSKRNNYWKNVVQKTEYGVILLYTELAEEEAFKLERQYIKHHNPSTNLTDGGEGISGYRYVGEKLEKHRKQVKYHMNRKDVKEKLSKIKKKQYNADPKYSVKLRQAKLKSIKEDPTQVERQRKSLLKYYEDPNNRHKNSKSRGGLEFVAIKDDSIIWQGYSQKMCAEELRLQQPNINKCLKGVRKTSGGYNFRYL